MKFELNEREYNAYVEFVIKCKLETPSAPTTIGGRFSITFTPTSVGLEIHITDNQTGKTKDITDAENW